MLHDTGQGHPLSRCTALVCALFACSSRHPATSGDAHKTADVSPDTLAPIATLPVATGVFFSCARRADATVACWGYGAAGALGNGSDANSTSPVTVTGLSDAHGLSASFAGACTLTKDALVECWGDDRTGELGDGGTLNHSNIPVQVPGVRDVVQVTTSLGVCALLADSQIECWGRYSVNGPIALRRIAGTAGTVAMAPRFDDHVCVLMNDASVRCWDAAEIAVPVSALPAATAVAVGFQTSCALLTDETVMCWGDNSTGQLGDGGAEPESSVPVHVTALTGAVAIAMSSSYACAVKADGSAVCWGNNEYGQLGNGTTMTSTVPVPVSGLTNVVGIAPAEDHACAQLADGAIACWGGNDDGGLGVPPSSTQGSACNCATTPIVVPI
jgi:alpha-tubulin suppressor-like RCC1 family protein